MDGRNGLSEVPLDSVNQVIERSTASLSDGPYNPDVLCRHLILRSGLLREPTTGHIDFVHKSFQEYLAAKALISTDNVGELISNADNHQWEQVVVFSAGQGNIRQISDLLNGLLNKHNTGKMLRRARLLAVACMGETRGLNPDVLNKLNQVTSKLVPPRSVEEAETLSIAGERIIRYLAKLRRTDPTINAAIIRCAALVGGLNAMKLISSIAVREEFEPGDHWEAYISPGTIHGELMLAWEYFEPEAYASAVIAPSGLDAIAVQDENLLQYVRRMPEIKAITIEIPYDLDLTTMAELQQLQSVSFVGGNMKSLTGLLGNSPDLSAFKLLACERLSDISQLSNYANLSYLWISYCQHISDYDVLRRLSSLESLWLQGQENVDLSVLSDLPSFKDLTMAECGTVDIRPLANSDIGIYVFEDTGVVDYPTAGFRPVVSRNWTKSD